jgi:hypothetical protein
MMNTSSTPSTPQSMVRRALLVSACLIGAAFVQLPALHAATSSALVPLATDKAPSAPLKAKFEKTKTDGGPAYVLKLKNESKEALEVTVTVYLSVFAHNQEKARHLPAHVIPAGKTWTVSDLAALDKVKIATTAFAPLELEVK